MKKIFGYLAAAAIAVTSFVFTSCGDDEDESQNPLVGTWQYDKDASTIVFNGESDNAGDNDIFGESVIFKEDGTFSTSKVSGTYSLNGHEFAISYEKGGKNYTIKKGEDIFDIVAGDKKEAIEKYTSEASAIVDDCKVNFNGDNQIMVTLVVTQDITLGKELSDNLLLISIVEAFAGKSTQTLVFNKK